MATNKKKCGREGISHVCDEVFIPISACATTVVGWSAVILLSGFRSPTLI